MKTFWELKNSNNFIIVTRKIAVTARAIILLTTL